MKKCIATMVIFTLSIMGSGCDSGSKTPPPSAPAGGATAALPATLFLKAAPANAKDVGESVKSAKPGDTVVIRGDIGGSEEPFVNQRAIMTIVDLKIKDCDEMGEKGHCKTPWDYCCEPRESLKVNLASVQVVGADGKVMKADLKGQGGLDPLRRVVVEGKVAPESNKDSLVINATGVFVEPKSYIAARYNALMSPNAVNWAGLTFDEVAAGIPPHRRAALRAQYRAAFADGNSPDQVEIAPIVREQRDGELIKFVQALPDGLEIESVIIPMYRGEESWRSLCVSSQVGCRMGCTFCETAQLGLLRNLTAAQIVGQVLAARRTYKVDIRKLVFMGMGEPFDNFDEVVQSVRVLTDPSGLSMSKRQITISTVGRIAGLQRLGALGWKYLQVAVSLNAPNDEIRSQIMPVNRTEPMEALRQAMLDYPLRRNGYFMIEYVLIPGVNDRIEHAGQLADYLRPVRCCVNVIPYNPRRESPWPAPDEASIEAFMSALRDAGQYCKRRITKGREQMAACGQLGNRDLATVLRSERRLQQLTPASA